MALLEVQDIQVYYGMIQALRGVSFSVNEGEVIALIGANGAGKTTTLHTVTGLLRAKSGHIIYDGQDITKVPPHKIVTMGMAHVPEGRRVFANMTVLLGTNIILRYEDLQYEKQTDFVITSGEKTHFMMTLFQDSFEKAEDELHQMFRNAPEDVSPVKFAAMDLLLGCMKFPYICAVDSEIHNKNWNLSVLQDGIKRICQCENTEEVLNCLLNLFGTLIKQNTEGTDERNRKLVQSVLSYIEKNYSGDLSMDDLTEKFHVSRTYISRLLKKYAGKSFLEYLTDVRFQQVEKLIADNKYKQYEIAEMVGYKDFGYYIKVFKKRYGITPNEFRKYI